MRSHVSWEKICFLLLAFVWATSDAFGEKEVPQGIIDQIAKVVDPLVDQKYLPGYYLAIYHNDNLILVRSRGFADDDTRLEPAGNTLYAISSLTAPLTAIATLHLIERSDLTLETKIREYLPEFNLSKVVIQNDAGVPITAVNQSITIRHLLTHTSGLTDLAVHSRSLVDTFRQRNLPKDKAPIVRSPDDLSQQVNRLANQPLKTQPGRSFAYSQGFDVLARLIEVVSGRPFSTYLKDEVLTPLGMSDTSFSVEQSKLRRLARLYSPLIRTIQIPGVPLRYQKANILPKSDKNFGQTKTIIRGGKGLISSPDDYGRLLSYLMNRGVGYPDILSSDSLALMLTDQIGANLGKNALVGDLGQNSANRVFSLSLEITVDEDGDFRDPTTYDYFSGGGEYNNQFWLDMNHRTYGVFMTQHYPARYSVVEEIDDIVDEYLNGS